MTEPRYDYQDLLRFSRTLMERAGLDTEKATAIADVLVEADLLGHDTHGLNLLATNLANIESGAMAISGQPTVLRDRPAALTWDGKRLPGPWLVLKALEAAIPRARELGTCTVVIRQSYHIACLAAYLKRVADQGLADSRTFCGRCPTYLPACTPPLPAPDSTGYVSRANADCNVVPNNSLAASSCIRQSCRP